IDGKGSPLSWPPTTSRYDWLSTTCAACSRPACGYNPADCARTPRDQHAGPHKRSWLRLALSIQPCAGACRPARSDPAAAGQTSKALVVASLGASQARMASPMWATVRSMVLPVLAANLVYLFIGKVLGSNFAGPSLVGLIAVLCHALVAIVAGVVAR